jgi:hypothetical protein
MKDVYAVLIQKVTALNEVRRQVEALRIVAPLLTDEPEHPETSSVAGAQAQ